LGSQQVGGGSGLRSDFGDGGALPQLALANRAHADNVRSQVAMGVNQPAFAIGADTNTAPMEGGVTVA
jgi:hypothetical protein